MALKNCKECGKEVALVLFLVALLAVFPKTAFANVGLPLVAIILPPMWLGLVPIILVETIVNSRLLSIPFRRTLLPVTFGNITSTIVGIPFMWVVLATIEGAFFGKAVGLQTTSAKLYAVTIQSPWLIPYEHAFGWMIPAALLVFSVPCFIVSVLVEAPINRAGLSDVPSKLIWKVTAISNTASYICLGLLTWGEFLLKDNFRHIDAIFMPVTEWLMGLVFRIAKLLVA
jgi:hypothetical protein